MTQDIGPDEGTQAGQGPAGEQVPPAKRSTSWQWLALAIVLLLAIWLIWQYLGGTSNAPDTSSTSVSGKVVIVPGGSANASEPASGDAVSETVDSGPSVPDVVGLSTSSAIAAIRAAGYSASVTDVFGTSKPAGTVFQQNPTGGTRLDQGSTVGLLVQLRPGATPKVTVPKLTGLSQSAAQKKLESLGLEVVLSYFPDPGDPGRVHSQWPLAGDPVAAGGGVQIQVTVKP